MLELLRSIVNRNQISKLIAAMKDPVICEVGVRTGANLAAMITENVALAVGVDSYQDTGSYGTNDLLHSQAQLDQQYSAVVRKFASDRRVRIIRKFSSEACREFEDETFDFVYLDADHTYSGISKDLVDWYPKVKHGGILAGHDYIHRVKKMPQGQIKYGVIQAVEEFRNNYKIRPEHFHLSKESYASFFIVKVHDEA